METYAPFGRQNGLLSLAALTVILIGYGLLYWPPVAGHLSLTVAPLLLVLGYLVLVPAAILRRSPKAS